MPALRLAGLTAGYPRRPPVLHGVDLTVESGETVALLGPSGGGKSTLLKAVAGLLPATGTVEVLGHAAPSRPRPGTVGYIPQRLGLVRHATVWDNVLQGALHETPLWRSLLRRPARHVQERAAEALASVGILDKAHEPVHRLSGGQQRRVAVARSLVQRPRLLLADEFLGELDRDTVGAVVKAVDRLRREHGTTTILVEHHLEQARRIADRVLRLQDGQLQVVEP